MIKYFLAIALLVGCKWERDCTDPSLPVWPQIGSCIQNAASGSPGGPCLPDSTCDNGLQCVGGTCFECGQISNPPEPCCGGQMTSDPGTCYSGVCGPDPYGDGWFTCNDNGVPQEPGCAPGEKANFYVWWMDSMCGVHEQAFCAADQASAQQYADTEYAEAAHGTAGSDPNAPGVAPNALYTCPGGVDCDLTADGSQATLIYWFTQQDIMYCESYLGGFGGGTCTWTNSPDNNDTCPAP